MALILSLEVFLAYLQEFGSPHFSDLLYFPNACLIYIEQFWGGGIQIPHATNDKIYDKRF